MKANSPLPLCHASVHSWVPSSSPWVLSEHLLFKGRQGKAPRGPVPHLKDAPKRRGLQSSNPQRQKEEWVWLEHSLGMKCKLGGWKEQMVSSGSGIRQALEGTKMRLAQEQKRPSAFGDSGWS